MTQTTSGIRSVLSLAPVYSAFQRMVGDHRLRTVLASGVIRPTVGDRVLDLGCGPGSMLPYVEPAEYVGVDPSASYIDNARAKYRGRGSFHVGDATCTSLEALGGEFSVVLAIGVLHHLDDASALALVDFARRVLRRSGRLITIDPCLESGQSRFARLLILRDRGQNVRTSEATGGLLESAFDDVRLEVRHDLLRIPYTHVIGDCRV